MANGRLQTDNARTLFQAAAGWWRRTPRPTPRRLALSDDSVVSVLPGSSAGLTSSGGRLFTQVAGTVETRDQFGAQLATGDFNSNGVGGLAAAAPTEAVGSVFEVGAVSIIYGGGGGLSTSGGQLFTQKQPGSPWYGRVL